MNHETNKETPMAKRARTTTKTETQADDKLARAKLVRSIADLYQRTRSPELQPVWIAASRLTLAVVERRVTDLKVTTWDDFVRAARGVGVDLTGVQYPLQTKEG